MAHYFQMDGIAALAANPSNINDRLQHLEKDNQSLRDGKLFCQHTF